MKNIVLGICLLAAAGASFAQPCPLSYGTTDSAKSNKLFLYFPTADDATFPNYGTNVSPASAFDVADLNGSIGTTAALRDRIRDVVVDDYCEFNVQVLGPVTTNPATLPTPPARRVTLAIGSDSNGTAWGLAQEVDTGDTIAVDFARVWAGTYTTCEGGDGAGNCSPAGALTGANATLDRWAQAIGGTAAHEGGHTFGLAHTDDDPPSGACGQLGPSPLAGEDSYTRHSMPAGCYLSGEHRAGYRRHFSDRTYSLLAANVGLSIQTMHNWDLKNPNGTDGRSLAIDFLSALPAVNVAWAYAGSQSPWINPVVTGPSGMTTWKGTTYNRYRITWSASNPASPTPGIAPAGGNFHVGATFTGVDFNQPDPIIIQNVTLFDSGSNALVLHPRLPAYDTGAVDAANDSFDVHFAAPPDAPDLMLESAVVMQLPRVAAIESMIGDGRPRTRAGDPINPWSATECSRADLRRGGVARCTVAKLSDPHHVEVVHRLGEKYVVDCREPLPRPRQEQVIGDSIGKADDETLPTCAGAQRDLFPSTTVYIIATFVQPNARQWDPAAKRFIEAPLRSKVFYQFAGIRDVPSAAGARCCTMCSPANVAGKEKKGFLHALFEHK